MRTVDGQPKAVFATSVDITNARKLQQQVARSQRIESLGTLASGVAKAASAGVRHFLPKPYTAEKMLHTIRLFLDERSEPENAPK